MVYLPSSGLVYNNSFNQEICNNGIDDDRDGLIVHQTLIHLRTGYHYEPFQMLIAIMM